MENVRPHTDDDQAVVLALGHTGNWDLAGAWCDAGDRARHAPSRSGSSPRSCSRSSSRSARASGIDDPPADRLAATCSAGLVRAARDGAGILPLLADRDLTSTGLEVDLFGHRARVAAGPAALASRRVRRWSPRSSTTSGCAAPGAGRPGRRGASSSSSTAPSRCRRTCRAPTSVRALTQAWVDELAAGVRQRPQDWHMLQKVFVEDLDPERYAATLAARRGAPDEPAPRRAHAAGRHRLPVLLRRARRRAVPRARPGRGADRPRARRVRAGARRRRHPDPRVHDRGRAARSPCATTARSRA